MTSPACVNPNTEGIPDQPTNSPPLTEGEADSAQAQGSFEDEYAGLKKVEKKWMESTGSLSWMSGCNKKDCQNHKPLCIFITFVDNILMCLFL